MLIRRHPGKGEGKKSSPNVNAAKNKHDIYDQIIKLTKENQYLRTRIDCLQQELDRMTNAKDKYRNKYRALKDGAPSHPNDDDPKKNGIQNRPSNSESKGKIYFNARTDRTKKKAEPKNADSNEYLPNTRTEPIIKPYFLPN